ELPIALAPVGQHERPLRHRVDRLAHLVDILGIVEKNLEKRDVALAIEVVHRLFQRQVDEALVELRHADLEYGDDWISLLARLYPERRHGAARRDECQGVAGVQAKCIGDLAADGDADALVEALERALLDVLGDALDLLQIGLAHATYEDARSRICR